MFRLFAVGAWFTAVPVKTLPPVTLSAPSLTTVAILKPAMKLSAGLKVSAASSALTSAIAPLAVQMPLAAL